MRKFAAQIRLSKFDVKNDFYANENKIEIGNQIFKNWSSADFLGQNGRDNPLASLRLERPRGNRHDGPSAIGAWASQISCIERILAQMLADVFHCFLVVANSIHKKWPSAYTRNSSI